MPGLNFDAQFAEQVRSRSKRQTIRARRKRPIRAGDRLHLWFRQRRPDRKKVGEATCLGTVRLDINTAGIALDGAFFRWSSPVCELIAHRDGFADAVEMHNWFLRRHGLPFSGQLIWW